jgi:hypothetical protein
VLGTCLSFSSCRLGHFWPIGDPRHWPFGVWDFYSKAVFMAWRLTIKGRSRPVARKTIERGPLPPGRVLGAYFALSLMPIGGIMGQLATHSTGHLGFE